VPEVLNRRDADASRRAFETPHEVAARRMQRAERVIQWRQSRLANDAPTCRQQQTATVRRLLMCMSATLPECEVGFGSQKIQNPWFLAKSHVDYYIHTIMTDV
jgi:hypothetical protein